MNAGDFLRCRCGHQHRAHSVNAARCCLLCRCEAFRRAS